MRSKTTITQEVYDNNSVRTEFSQKIAEMPVSNYTHRTVILGAGADLVPLDLAVTPINQLTLFSDQNLYMKIGDQVNCPYIPIGSFWSFDGFDISAVWLSNPTQVTATVDVYILNRA